MKRLRYTAKAGDVLTLTIPLELGGLFTRRRYKIQTHVEIRSIANGKVDLIVLGPNGGAPVVEV